MLIDFKAREEFIAEVLCINKDQPITLCKGQCYLTRQLQKTEDKQDKQAAGSKNEKQELLYCSSCIPFDFLNRPHALSPLFPSFKELAYHTSCINTVFRPPQYTFI